MRSPVSPRFRGLGREEIDAVLGRNQVGRVAFARGNQVDIVPILYAFTGDWIYGRTAPDTLIGQVGERWWPVAFEVDEVEGPFDWRSVVVKGGLYIVPEEGPIWEREAWHEGVEKLRSIVPGTLSENDPVPERSMIFRIAVQEVTGRAASTG